MTSPTNSSLWAVVPAGGAGTRLWPVSRAAHPKFLRDLSGSGRTMLQETVRRLSPLVGEQILVVTGEAHAAAVREQVSVQVLAEPSPRDSMAAIGWAAAVLERRDPDAIMGSFAADHVIGDEESFRNCVSEAVDAAAEGHLVTIGIEPTGPSTAFGYIELGEPLPGHPSARQVESFVEKPESDRAAVFVANGNYRWNAGMFVARATTILDLLGDSHPEMASALRELAAEPGRIDEIWPHLTRIAIDHAVAEPAAAAGRVVCIPGPFDWDDVGDFAALASLADDDLVIKGDADLVRAIDAGGLVWPHDRMIAVIGIPDAVVIDTGDAVLVTTLEHAQRVKDVVAELKESGRSDLT